MLRDYGKSTSSVNPFLILDTAWKVPPNEWKLMRTTLDQVDSDCPKELQWKVSRILLCDFFDSTKEM
jgi:hypothetical protein